jgi:hypothetical protein
MSETYKTTGVITKIMDNQQITDTFNKRTFVIEVTDGNYTNLMAFELFGEKQSLIDLIAVDSTVEVSWNARSNQSKTDEDRYFSSFQAWKIDIVSRTDDVPPHVADAASRPVHPASQPDPLDDLGF